MMSWVCLIWVQKIIIFSLYYKKKIFIQYGGCTTVLLDNTDVIQIHLIITCKNTLFKTKLGFFYTNFGSHDIFFSSF